MGVGRPFTYYHKFPLVYFEGYKEEPPTPPVGGEGAEVERGLVANTSLSLCSANLLTPGG